MTEVDTADLISLYISLNMTAVLAVSVDSKMWSNLHDERTKIKKELERREVDFHPIQVEGACSDIRSIMYKLARLSVSVA